MSDRLPEADFRTTIGPVTTNELAADCFRFNPRFPRRTLSNDLRALFFISIYASLNAMKTQHWQPVRRLVNTGARLGKLARYYWVLLAESHLTRRLFGAMLRRIAALPLPGG